MNLRKLIGLLIVFGIAIYYAKIFNMFASTSVEYKDETSSQKSQTKNEIQLDSDKKNTIPNKYKNKNTIVDSRQNLHNEDTKIKIPITPTIKNIENPKAILISKENSNSENSIHFKLEDGLVIFQEDVVLGTPVNNNFPTEGQIETPALRLWDGGEIPFSISQDLQNSNRVLEAFQLFKDTPIQFVPVESQQDGVVFVEGKGTCKSYLGKVGGLQPLWVAPDCGPAEIAHELMHALGFIHEQNRSDRDQFVSINWANIQKQYIYNFDLLPTALMAVSGVAPFDYQSIMIYPEKAFAINKDIKTISTKTKKMIEPMRTLSSTDIARLQKIYGR